MLHNFVCFENLLKMGLAWKALIFRENILKWPILVSLKATAHKQVIEHIKQMYLAFCIKCFMMTITLRGPL